MNKASKEDVYKILSNFGLDKLKEIIVKAEKENMEHGFNFCRNDLITTTDLCTGTECSVEKPGCKENKKTIGSFHTHQRADSIRGGNIPSDNDLFVAYERKMDFTCIGLIEKDIQKVKCYLSDFGIGDKYIRHLNRYRENYENKLKEHLPELTDVNLYNIVDKVDNSKLNIHQKMEILDIVKDYVDLLNEGTKNAQMKIYREKSSDLTIELR